MDTPRQNYITQGRSRLSGKVSDKASLVGREVLLDVHEVGLPRLGKRYRVIVRVRLQSGNIEIAGIIGLPTKVGGVRRLPFLCRPLASDKGIVRKIEPDADKAVQTGSTTAVSGSGLACEADRCIATERQRSTSCPCKKSEPDIIGEGAD